MRRSLLDQLESTLLHIRVLLPSDKHVWDDNELLRLAISQLWVQAGNAAELHRRSAGEVDGAQPWAELYDFRCVLAHATPDRVDHDLVFADSAADVDRLIEEVRAAQP